LRIPEHTGGKDRRDSSQNPGVKKRPTQQYASPSSEYKILAKTGKKDSDWPKTESEIFAHKIRPENLKKSEKKR
jgi:hypothetical protein